MFFFILKGLLAVKSYAKASTLSVVTKKPMASIAKCSQKQNCIVFMPYL